jgi:hypothetical protein
VICLNIDFHETDRGGESHGGYDQRLVMVESVMDVMGIMRYKFYLCVRCLETCNSSLGKRGRQHRWTTFLVALLENRATILKTQGLAFIGCT